MCPCAEVDETLYFLPITAYAFRTSVRKLLSINEFIYGYIVRKQGIDI